METNKININTPLSYLWSLKELHAIRKPRPNNTSFEEMTIRDICVMTDYQLSRTSNVGIKSIEAICNVLEKYGLRVAMTDKELDEYAGKTIADETPKVDDTNKEERIWQLYLQNVNKGFSSDANAFKYAIESYNEYIKLYQEYERGNN